MELLFMQFISTNPSSPHLPQPWGGSHLPPTNPWSSRCCAFPLWHLPREAICLYTVSWLSGIQKVLKAAAIRLRWEPAHGEFPHFFVCDLSCFFLKNYAFFTFEHQVVTGEPAYVGLLHGCVNHLGESVIPVYFLACCSSAFFFSFLLFRGPCSSTYVNIPNVCLSIKYFYFFRKVAQQLRVPPALAEDQPFHGGSQLCLPLVLGGQMLSSSLQGHQKCMWYRYIHASKHSHI